MPARSTNPVIKGVSYFLGHVPGMVRYGSKPSREIGKDPSILPAILNNSQSFDQAVAYPPNQVFIGNMDPDSLLDYPSPWYQNPLSDSSRWGESGEIMPEEEFYGMMKICDEFELLALEKEFLKDAVSKLDDHPLFGTKDTEKLNKGYSPEEIEERLDKGDAIPLFLKDRLIGCCQRPKGSGAEEDPNLLPGLMLENLTARASGVMALRNLISRTGDAHKIDYLLGCGEEAVGDRYNRGGGNMAKAIGEKCGCLTATGSDVKAFCCAPVHAIVLAASLVSSGIFKNVAVVAGGSLAKLGMKFQGHLHHDIPILENVMAGIAVWVGRDDGISPVIRLDSIGKHEIQSGSSQRAILDNLVIQPLDRMGLQLTQIDKYATEMHNPEITEPQGSGNVPLTNYRTIGSFAVLRNEIGREELDAFVRKQGMPGFSPTQGHIASAVPVLGHSIKKMIRGDMGNTMFLFLGRLTQLSDGISFFFEKNKSNITEE